MKDFLKYTGATIVGLLITGLALSVLGLITIIGILSSSSDTSTPVGKQSVFVLDLAGDIQERYTPSPLDQLLGEDIAIHGLDNILSSIRKAKHNQDIKGIYLNAEAFSCQPASLQAIRRELIDFKKSGKFIVAYAGTYSQSTYYLASVADKIALNPSGNICWHGLSGQTVFFKGLLDKLGIEMQVFRVGTYKAAVEPFVSTEMSAANREQTLAFTNSIWDGIVRDVSASRHIPADKLNALADRNMEYSSTEECVKQGLADTLMYKDQMLDYLKNLCHHSKDQKLNTLSLEDMINLRQDNTSEKSQNIIAVYYAFGEIDGSPSYNSEEGINSENVIRDLRNLRNDKNIKAVILRVNSPGGSAYGSEQIWREITLLKSQKPVIVSMGDYAASGGYYISCAADWIVAEPATLTGSIGIFGMVPNAEKLLSDKLGLKFDGVKTNRLADMGQFNRPFNAEEKALMQQTVDRGYRLFIQRCADGRHLNLNDLEKIAEGRVWTGEMAKEIKLVDQLGGLDTAIKEATRRAGIKHYTIVSYPAKSNMITTLLQASTERYILTHLSMDPGPWEQSLRFLQHIGKADRLQARIPFILTLQ